MSGSQARLSLRVSPGARKSAVVGRYGERWKIRVTAPAESGKANEALIALLGKTLGVARSQLRVVAGAGSRDKIVEVKESTPRRASACSLPRRRRRGK